MRLTCRATGSRRQKRKGGRYDKGSAAALVLLVMACIVIVPYLVRNYRRERS